MSHRPGFVHMQLLVCPAHALRRQYPSLPSSPLCSGLHLCSQLSELHLYPAPTVAVVRLLSQGLLERLIAAVSGMLVSKGILDRTRTVCEKAVKKHYALAENMFNTNSFCEGKTQKSSENSEPNSSQRARRKHSREVRTNHWEIVLKNMFVKGNKKKYRSIMFWKTNQHLFIL